MKLDVHDITVTFGGIHAVSHLSFDLESTESVAIIGPNGSGKTTLLNAICGLIPASGSVSLEGRHLAMGKPVRIARSGLARTFQTPQVIDGMSCIDNVLLSAADRRYTGLGAAWIGRPAMMRAERERWRLGSECLERFGLGDMATQPASRLTYGQRRWLELARVTAAKPRFLLTDEPAAGLNDAETEELAAHLASIRADGIGLVIVDHKIEFLTEVADRAIVLSLGQKIAQSPIEQVWDLSEVQEAYLGSRRVRA